VLCDIDIRTFAGVSSQDWCTLLGHCSHLDYFEVHFGALDGNMQPAADLDALAQAIATKLPAVEHLALGFKASASVYMHALVYWKYQLRVVYVWVV
jgi:hypothetical protein